MKKILVLGIAILIALTTILSACNSGIPNPPVSNLINLDKLVVDKMTLEQVYSMLNPALKGTSNFYQAQKAVLGTSGSWTIASKKGGFATGETGPYQVLFFTPAKAGREYYAVFFKDNAVFGKTWFSYQYGIYVESILKGVSLTQ